jgi:glyoxylase-like metal-dependent hydrolase (beta-lactamase superfamily II)
MQATGLTFPFAAPPAEAEATEVAPGLFWIRLPLPLALDHVNVWAATEPDGWTLIDTGYGDQRSRDLWVRLLEGPLAGGPVVRVVATHMHPDHVGLAGWLAPVGTPLLMPQAEYWEMRALWADIRPEGADDRMRFYRACGLAESAAAGLAGRDGLYRRAVSPPPLSYRRIEAGDVVPIAGADWAVVTGAGHSVEMACLFSAAHRVLIAADQVLPRISPNVSVWSSDPLADPLSAFLRSLARLADLPGDVLVLPAHGLPFYGLHERIAALAAHHAERLEETAAICGRGATVADVTRAMFPRALDSHQTMFALGEAMAHLNHLVRRGRLAERAAGGVRVFSRG